MSKLLVHVPHSSLHIPANIRNQLLLSDTELTTELQLMTDLHTDTFFSRADKLIYPFSRLVCDVERFENDSEEPMSKLGMGAVYTHTSTGAKLRDLLVGQRDSIIDTYYKPHHKEFESLVAHKLLQHNACVILDCHSFNEEVAYLTASDFPDICIGTDDYHTPPALLALMSNLLKARGYTVGINTPFSGSIVPLKFYIKDKRVKSIMLEVNRRVYIDQQMTIDDQALQKLLTTCNALTDLLTASFIV